MILRVVCGVGGVGKTTLSAAMGVGYALAGHRTLVLTVDPAKRLADALGQDLGPTPTRVPLDAPGTLDAMMVDQKHAFDDAIRRLHPDPEAATRLLENRYYQAASRHLAGTPEYMTLETLFQVHEEGLWDVVVVDTPPASDALDVFRAPERIARLFGRNLLSVLLAPTGWASVLAAGGLATLGRLVGGTVLDDIAGFFRLAGGLTRTLGAHAKTVSRLLRSDEAGTLLVVDADAPDRAEETAFAETLRRIGPRFLGTLVNRVAPDPGVIPLRPLSCPPDIDPASWRTAVGRLFDASAAAHRAAVRHEQVVTRLGADGPVWAVPRLHDRNDTLDTLTRLSAALPPALPRPR